MKADARLTLEDIAALLSHPAAPPACVVPCLQHFIPLIGSRLPDDEDDDVAGKLLAAAEYLQRYLPMYERAEKQFGFEAPDWLDDLLLWLDQAVPDLAAEAKAASPRQGVKVKGGQIPDTSRELCAAVCLDIWRRLHHDGAQPYSSWLQKACEDYWQACGWPPTSTTGRLKNWEPFLLRVRSEPGDEIEIIDKFFSAPAPTS